MVFMIVMAKVQKQPATPQTPEFVLDQCMHLHVPNSRLNAANRKKVYITSFAPIGDLQPLCRLVVFFVVLVSGLFLLAVCLGNSATRSRMIAFSRSELGSY